jgi:hypothetical protein
VADTLEEKATEALPWRRSRVFRSRKGREWIEIENDERIICEISNSYLAIKHLEKEDEEIADRIVSAVNSHASLEAENKALKAALVEMRDCDNGMCCHCIDVMVAALGESK